MDCRPRRRAVHPRTRQGGVHQNAATPTSACHSPEDELTQKLQRLGQLLDNPYESPSIKKALKSEKIRRTLECFQVHDPDYYKYDSSCSNLLSFVYIQNQNKQAAAVECENVRKDNPKNILATLHQLYIEKNGQNFSKAVSLADEVLHYSSDITQMVTYAAEMAYMYFRLGPGFYKKAMTLYSGVLQWVLFGETSHLDAHNSPNSSILNQDNLTTTQDLLTIWEKYRSDHSPLGKTMIGWIFQVAQFNGKLLGRAHIHILRNLERFNVENFFTNVCHLLDFVAKTNDVVFQGRAWTEMADIYKMYELTGRKDDRHCVLPNGLSPDTCMKQALGLHPDNAHVLQFAGRHFRQKATCTDDFEYALTLLQRAVEICPAMHVAFHHMALAWRAVWLIEGKYEERKLHLNNDRHPKPNKKYRADTHSHYENLANSVATVHPRRPHDVGKSPKYFKNPDYFDKLRTNNPLVRRRAKGDEYLCRAQTYLDEARKITNDTSARYCIDLARIHISLKSDKRAICDLFEKAQQLISDDLMSNFNEAALLYEQWGLFLAKDLEEEAKGCFRKSLECSVLGKQRSRVAFYKLRDILANQCKDQGCCPSIVKESAFIHKLIEQYEKARQIIRDKLTEIAPQGINHPEDLMELALKENPENFSLLFELLDILYQEENFTAAFHYLQIAMQYYMEFECDEGQTLLARNIIIQLVPNDSSSVTRDEFADSFRWLYPCKVELEDLSTDEDSSTHEERQEDKIQTRTDETGVAPGHDASTSCEDKVCSGTRDQAAEDNTCLADDCSDVPRILDLVLVTNDVHEPLIMSITEAFQECCALEVFQACTGIDGDWAELDCDSWHVAGFECLTGMEHQVRTWIIDLDGLNDNTKLYYHMVDKSLSKNDSTHVLRFSRSTDMCHVSSPVITLKSHESRESQEIVRQILAAMPAKKAVQQRSDT